MAVFLAQVASFNGGGLVDAIVNGLISSSRPIRTSHGPRTKAGGTPRIRDEQGLGLFHRLR
jgi:hypothetical protein